LNAGHPKFGTTIGKYRRHGNLPDSPSAVVRSGNGLRAFGLGKDSL
jgi:hypothetical protein